MLAIRLCVSLFVLMAAMFTRPALVEEPGLAQVGAMFLVLAATVGITFALQARFSDKRAVDVAARIALSLFSLVVLFHGDLTVATLACIPVLLFGAYWVFLRRKVEVLAGAG